MKYRRGHPFLIFFLPHRQVSSLCSQPIRGKVRRTGRIFPEHVERSFLDPEYSFVAVRRIPRTRLAKQKFVQLRISYVGLGSTKSRTMFAQLRTGLRLTKVTAALRMLFIIFYTTHCTCCVLFGSNASVWFVSPVYLFKSSTSVIGHLRRNQLWQWLEEGKPVLGVCSLACVW